MTDRKRIPTNLITGFLGVGKTTAIRHLIQQKPADERWGVLVNEFGEVGIDGTIIEAAGRDGVSVSEVAGGCFCCSSDAPIEFSLTELIQQSNPDRILIEPTGLGHPAKVLETLRGPWFRGVVDLRATVCLADASDYANPHITNVEVFQDQLNMADVVVINKTDRTHPDQINQFDNFLQQMFPPKSAILHATQGKLDQSILDADISPERTPLFPDAHPRSEGHQTEHRISSVSLLLPGHPIRKESKTGTRAACGWIFSPIDVFRRVELFQLLSGSLDVHRLKGVFHVGQEWLLFNRVAGDLTCQSIPYCRDSRVELISNHSQYDWTEFENQLMNCLRHPSA